MRRRWAHTVGRTALKTRKQGQVANEVDKYGAFTQRSCTKPLIWVLCSVLLNLQGVSALDQSTDRFAKLRDPTAMTIGRRMKGRDKLAAKSWGAEAVCLEHLQISTKKTGDFVYFAKTGKKGNVGWSSMEECTNCGISRTQQVHLHLLLQLAEWLRMCLCAVFLPVSVLLFV